MLSNFMFKPEGSQHYKELLPAAACKNIDIPPWDSIQILTVYECEG